MPSMLLRSPRQGLMDYALTRDCSQWHEGPCSPWEGWRRGSGSHGRRSAFRGCLGKSDSDQHLQWQDEGIDGWHAGLSGGRSRGPVGQGDHLISLSFVSDRRS